MPKLKAGDIFPNYKVCSVLGTEIIPESDIKTIMGGKPTMFWFQRYIGCPPCRLDVHLLTVNYEKFVQQGVNIVVVMQSKPEIVLRDIVDNSLPFHLICNPDESLYKDLEIGDMSKDSPMSDKDKEKLGMKMEMMKEGGKLYEHGDYEGNEAQAPAFFYLDKDMTVIEAHYASNIADMPLAAEALEKIN